jgi:predicted P-loop ATPase
MPAAVQLTDQVNDFLRTGYHFRYNRLTEETEFRPQADSSAPYRPVGKRELNSLCLAAHAQGIPCWDKDIQRYIYSTEVPAYHPFQLYMESLPAWDGTDRLDDLARRVSSDAVWLSGFRRWMLGLAAQWMGITGRHGNGVAPILVSARQGCLKSTFCKSLMPEPLLRYYTDEVDLTSRGNITRKMSEMGLLNLDEFDKYPASRMPQLKNLLQMADLNLCKAYQKNFRNLPRIASFIGTSNRFDLLTDPTGSRRFLCVEVRHRIDCSDIPHDQIYAQLRHLLLAGERYWFTADEERELQSHNRSFQRHDLADDLLHQCFRPATSSDDASIVLRLTAADIFRQLRSFNAAAMRQLHPNTFAQKLSPAGFRRQRGHYNSYYAVVPLIGPLAQAKPDE